MDYPGASDVMIEVFIRRGRRPETENNVKMEEEEEAVSQEMQGMPF